MKILNLYAGIGGNRKLWGKEHDITAVELRPEIAAIYQRFELEPVLLEVNQNRFISTRSFGKKLFFLKHTAKKTLSLKMLFLTISR